MSVVPRYSYFKIFYSNRGINRLVYNKLFEDAFARQRYPSETIHQLAYVTCIAYLYRLVNCAWYCGFPGKEWETLLIMGHCIKLPVPLAEYIECIGLVKLRNGATIAPWVGPRENLFADNLGQISPRNILMRANREVPNNYWWLDDEWIANWNQNISRLHMRCREVHNSNFDGRIESVVTPIITEGRLKATSPEMMSQKESTLGALYDWRSFEQSDVWPAETNIICVNFFNGFAINADGVLHNIINNFPITDNDTGSVRRTSTKSKPRGRRRRYY